MQHYNREYLERVLSYCRDLQLSGEDCMATITGEREREVRGDNKVQ